jgi:hypothetical protein
MIAWLAISVRQVRRERKPWALAVVRLSVPRDETRRTPYRALPGIQRLRVEIDDC